MVQKKKLYIILLSIVVYVLLNLVYKNHIWPDYAEMGFGYEPNSGRSIVALLIFMLFSIFISRYFHNFLFSFFTIYGLVFLAPNLVLYHAMQSSIVVILAICLIPIFVFLFSGTLPALKIHPITENQRIKSLWIVIIILFIPFPLTYGLGVDLSTLTLENVYIVRESAAATANRFTAYFYSSLSSWLLPMAIIYSLWKKQWKLLLLASAIELYLFLVTGNKITLLILFVLAGFALRRGWYEKALLFQFGLLIAIVSLLAAPDLTITTLVEDLLLRRFAFLPALLNVQYLEYFREPLYYSYSFLSGLSEYPFMYPPPQMIGLVYYGSEQGNMTNGVIADAIINLGSTGVVIMPILCGLVITYFEKLKIAPQFFALFFMLIQNFIDSAFFTSILTHGLLLFMIVAGLVLNKTHETVE